MEYEGFTTWEEVPGPIKEVVAALCTRFRTEAMTEKAMKDATALTQTAHLDQQMQAMTAQLGSADAREAVRAKVAEFGDVMLKMLYSPSNIELMVATGFEAARLALTSGKTNEWCALDEEYRAIVGNRLGEESMRIAGNIARMQASDSLKEVLFGLLATIGQDIGREGFTWGMAGGMQAASDGTEHTERMVMDAIEVGVQHLLSVVNTVDPEAS